MESVTRANRLNLEKRLLLGCQKRDNETDEEYAERNARITLNRLHWLAGQGCRFAFDLEVETKARQQYIPGWNQQEVKSSVNSMDIRFGRVNYDETYSDLLSVSLATTLTKAYELSGRSDDLFTEKDPYAGLCKAKPVRAFSALTKAAKQGDFPEWAWADFFDSPVRENDKPLFLALIAERISCYPAKSLSKNIHSISSWLKKNSKTLAVNFPSTYQRIVAKLIEAIELQPSSVGSAIVRGNQAPDWIFEAINSSVGDVAQILMTDPGLNKLKIDEGLPRWWLSQVSKLLALPGNLRCYVLVIFARGLNWLYSIDSCWTEDNLLTVLSLDNLDDRHAVFSGFLWACQTPHPKLYSRLKPEILSLVKNGNFSPRRGHEEALAGIILAGWGSIMEENSKRWVTNDELHDLILHCDDEFRSHLIWHLKEWSKDDDPTAGKKWCMLLPELFRNVWPKQKSVKTPTISAELFDLTFSDAQLFNKIADLILPLLSNIKRDYLFLDENIENILDLYPERAFAIIYKVFSDDCPTTCPYDLEPVLDRMAKADKQLRADPRWLELKRKLNAR